MQLALSTSANVEDPNFASPDNQNDQGSFSSVWGEVFDESGTSQDEDDQEDASRIELQNYLKERRSQMSTGFLSWWKVIGSKMFNKSSKIPAGHTYNFELDKIKAQWKVNFKSFGTFRDTLFY